MRANKGIMAPLRGSDGLHFGRSSLHSVAAYTGVTHRIYEA